MYLYQCIMKISKQYYTFTIALIKVAKKTVMTLQTGLAYIQTCPAQGSDGAKRVIFAMILIMPVLEHCDCNQLKYS